jgi:DNA repair protein RecN (Recombination protein N)
MLHEIHIQNYAVIDNLTVEFHPGLNLLSGETGSGKSILVDALGLALGGRASPDVIRTGTERATITAVFSAESGSAEQGSPSAAGAGPSLRLGQALKAGATPRKRAPWTAWLDECGLASRDEAEIILRREIQAGGKSRLLVNDQPVTLAAVKDLARILLEVHGQNEHVALFARDAQLDLVDQFAGAEENLEKVGRIFVRRRELQQEMETLSQNEQERLRAMDLLQFQVQELDRAQPQPGEDTSLEEERRVLVNLERIRTAAAAAFSQLYEQEGSACALLANVSRALEELRRYDSRVEGYIDPLAGARATLEDLAFFLRDYLGKLEANPHRLEEVEDRLALMERLKRKYGETIEEMLVYRDQSRQQLASLEHADERRETLGQEIAQVAEEYQRAAQALSEQRRAAARKMERAVREELGQLGMEKTRFEIRFREAVTEGPVKTNDRGKTENWKWETESALETEPARTASSRKGGPKGVDDIELLISPNPGEEMRPLERIASGGELSRLMLALKTVLGKARLGGAARAANWAPTFVFDEVDAGIGGRVAESVGQRLKRLARDAQVLCVTHLPQIACFADHHFYVEKVQRAGRTVTVVTYLASQNERARELARMLSGSQITDAVLKHAATMLKQAVTSDK